MNLAEFIPGKPSVIRERQKRYEAIARMIHGSKAQHEEKRVSTIEMLTRMFKGGSRY